MNDKNAHILLRKIRDLAIEHGHDVGDLHDLPYLLLQLHDSAEKYRDQVLADREYIRRLEREVEASRRALERVATSVERAGNAAERARGATAQSRSRVRQARRAFHTNKRLLSLPGQFPRALPFGPDNIADAGGARLDQLAYMVGIERIPADSERGREPDGLLRRRILATAESLDPQIDICDDCGRVIPGSDITQRDPATNDRLLCENCRTLFEANGGRQD